MKYKGITTEAAGSVWGLGEGSQSPVEAEGGGLPAKYEPQPKEEQHLGGCDQNDTCRKINRNVSDLSCKASFKYAGAIFILIAPH